ncbi:MAG: XRE family transcriptional regulator [Flavobacteriales bacterium]
MKRPPIHVQVEKTETGFSAYARDASVFTTATSVSALYTHLLEALELHNDLAPGSLATKDLRLHLDFQQFFQHYRVLNAKFLAERIGMNPTLLSQYVSGKKQPSQRQQARILMGIQTIGRELAELQWKG